jgi:hypothetical protein
MIPVLNDIDKLLQAAPSRYGQAIERALNLTASARSFDVALDATVTPAAIVFIASGPGMTGPVQFTTDNGTELTVAGNVATLTPAGLVGSGVTVTASMTVEGQPYVARQTVARVLAFDSSPPPAPVGLATAGTLATIQLTWSATNNVNVGKVEIWRSLTDDLGAAVAVGATAGLARSYADNIGAAGSFFYWIRYISKANVAGPFNSVAGTSGTAGTDGAHILQLLTNRITKSQLLADLRAEIELLTASEGTPGSVNARIKTETDARVNALIGEVTARETYVKQYTYSKAETNESQSLLASDITANYRAYANAARDVAISAAAADIRNYSYSQAGTNSAIAAMASTLRSEFAAAGNASESYVQNYTYSKSAFDSAQAGQTSSITAAYKTYADGARDQAVTTAAADVRNYSYSQAGTNSAIASMATTLRAEFASGSGASEAYVQSYAYSKATVDSAIAQSTSQLTSTVGGHTTTLQTQGSSIDGLRGQFTVKIDSNGYVTGYGLASGAVNGVPTSSFIVNAANFAVAAPGVVPKVMFSVGQINGQTAVGIGGVAVLDDAITARALDVQQLSAITGVIGTLRTATTGARTEIHDNVLKMFNASNLRVLQLGDLTL